MTEQNFIENSLLKGLRPKNTIFIINPLPPNDIQASLVIRDLTLRVFAITRFRGMGGTREKIVDYNFTVTVYGGGVTVWSAHQLVTSYQYQCEREC
jgi:hypothetical protein